MTPRDRPYIRSEMPKRIFAFATLGSGSTDEARIATLLNGLHPQLIPFDHRAKLRSFWRVYTTLWRERPDLAVMEGTGLAGGVGLLLAKWLAGVSYVVSSGDAVGPFVAHKLPGLGLLFAAYERLLCRHCAGFIGWTPYLVGRALTFGAARAMTAAGFAPFLYSDAELAVERLRVRQQLGIAADTLVFGLSGSLIWNRRVRYCYGLELVAARLQAEAASCKVLVVGDGSGLPHLEKLAGDRLGHDIYLTGRVPQEQVPHYLAAMDVLSLPQSVDRLGSFRYTTKLSEYLMTGLPMVTGQIPLAYDLDDGWLWRLPGDAPWDEPYIQALARLMTSLTPDEYQGKKRVVPRNRPDFDRERQIRRVENFILDLLEERHR